MSAADTLRNLVRKIQQLCIRTAPRHQLQTSGQTCHGDAGWNAEPAKIKATPPQ
jgi:hypothetical protein